MQRLDTLVITESLGELIKWCKEHEFYAALQRHKDLDDPYCMPLFAAFVLGSDIKAEYPLHRDGIDCAAQRACHFLVSAAQILI